MINRKLLEVLARLEEEDLKRFDLFLRSPYFNAGSNAAQVIGLYDYITRFQADETHPSLEKAVVFGVFYPEKKFVENEKSALDTLTSDLFRLAKKFLVQQNWEKDINPISESIPQLRFYRKHRLDERYIQLLKNVRKIFEGQAQRGGEAFYDKYRFEEEVANFKTLNNTYQDDANIESLFQSLDIFYILSTLTHSAFLGVQKRFSSGINLDVSPLHQAAVKLARQNYCKDAPIAEILITILTLLDNPGEDNLLYQLNNDINTHKNKLQLVDYQNVKTCLRILWGFKHHKSGSEEDKNFFFKLMQEHLEEGLYYYDNKLMISSLTTLTSFGIACKQFDWVYKLLKNHPTERLVGTKFLEEGYQINWAEYYLALKDYDIASQHLQYKMFENPIYSIQAEVVLLRIYYETENELLDSRIKALEQKIRRTALSDEVKKSFQSFVQKLDKLNKYRYQRNSPKFAKLVEEIKNTPGLRYRNWLLEKVS